MWETEFIFFNVRLENTAASPLEPKSKDMTGASAISAQTYWLTQLVKTWRKMQKFNGFQKNLLNVLQISDTALKTRSEKLTLTLMCFMLGSWRRSSLCCGVKRSRASAWMPYLSSVQWVFRSHVFFFSHHRAWSDQSFFTSERKVGEKHQHLETNSNLSMLILLLFGLYIDTAV